MWGSGRGWGAGWSGQRPADSGQLPATSHQPPATSHQPPATSGQRPATSRQPRVWISACADLPGCTSGAHHGVTEGTEERHGETGAGGVVVANMHLPRGGPVRPASGVEEVRNQAPTPCTRLGMGRHVAILRQPHGPSALVATDSARSSPRGTGKTTFSADQVARTPRVVATKADASSRCRTGARCLRRLPRRGGWGRPATSRQRPATSDQPPATSHQRPATSHQPPATSHQQPVPPEGMPARTSGPRCEARRPDVRVGMTGGHHPPPRSGRGSTNARSASSRTARLSARPPA